MTRRFYSLAVEKEWESCGPCVKCGKPQEEALPVATGLPALRQVICLRCFLLLHDIDEEEVDEIVATRPDLYKVKDEQ